MRAGETQKGRRKEHVRGEIVVDVSDA